MFLFYIFIFFLVFILLSALGIVGAVIRMFFRSPQSGNEQRSYSGSRQSTSTKWYTYGKKKKKVFDKNDGEYVDFEEIKDEK
ncbi:DUF4834 family protein [Coprobacter tertius]|uniref:DUF4834 family protein n=1 Tax=Coprobacter tertius TaxID=2944915 RepID=A0ABT1MGR5_9BACT|nr:DUF4834 family protein [Coprobacter tertius]MCP9611036.1 DUF4834 family protein [Coprobacter tertius]